MLKRVSFVLICVLAIAGSAHAAKAKPKLSVKSVSAPPASAKAGDKFAVTGKLANKGKKKGKARIKLSLRKTADGSVAAQIGSAKVRVRPKSKKRWATEATVPAAAPSSASAEFVETGSYVLVACVKRNGRTGAQRCKASASTVTIEAQQPVFTPGARTLDDPILPQLGNGGYDALAYEIALDFDPAANSLNAGTTTTMTAKATQNLSEFSLDFQDLVVGAVEVNGVAAGFTQVESTPDLGSATQPMKLVITPASGIVEGAQFTVEVSYSGTPEAFTDPDGSSEGWIPGPACVPMVSCDHYFVVGEPIGSQTWFPSNNHPSDKATIDTAITVPDGRTALGIGELDSRTTSAGLTTWRWTEDDPTATYLATASNGDFTYTPSSITEALTGRSLPIYDSVDALAIPSQTTAIEALTARNAEMVDFLGPLYGAYPLDSYGSVWVNNPTVGYALEVQTKSHFSSLPAGPAPSSGLASTYLHELAHQWWGNTVTNQRWSDLWFNEGWAQFSEWISGFADGSDPQSPEQHFDDEYDGAPAADWSLAPAGDRDPADLFDTFSSYTRGAMTIQGYREIVGDTIFYDFAKGLQAEFGYDSISTDEFIEFAKNRSGFTGAQLALLDDYFQQWLYGTVKPTITPDSF